MLKEGGKVVGIVVNQDRTNRYSYGKIEFAHRVNISPEGLSLLPYPLNQKFT